MIMDSTEGSGSITLPESLNHEIDITFLPLVYEIIRRFVSKVNYFLYYLLLVFCCFGRFSLERDPHDPAQKNMQLQDVSQKVLEVQNKLEEAREQVCII